MGSLRSDPSNGNMNSLSLSLSLFTDQMLEDLGQAFLNVHAVARRVAHGRRGIVQNIGEQVKPGDLDIDRGGVDQHGLAQEVDHFFTRVGEVKSLTHGHLGRW